MQSDSMWRLPDHPSKPFSFLFSTLLKLRHSRYPLPPRRGGWGMACDAWVGSAKRAKGPAASWSLRSAEWQMVKPHLHPYEVGYKWYIYMYINVRKHVLFISIYMLYVYTVYTYIGTWLFFFVGWVWGDSGFFWLRAFFWGEDFYLWRHTHLRSISQGSRNPSLEFISLVIVIKT